ncbi:MAG: NAD(P)/FAD-dependent oxidoreductase [Terasakiella sp.]|uniref:NAD(P)/FAD-dependent oxidoreductase n=1 Tax=unclassified Terasakiella TaxID=2614952 RepID=UPI003AFFE62F
MKTVIVGNGILALTSAFRLIRRGNPADEITIIGKPAREGSATLAAAAMLNSFAEIEKGGLESDLDLYRFELSHTATRMWKNFEEEIIEAAGDTLPDGCSKCLGCSGGGCFESGTYVVNNTAADDLDDENFDAIVQALDDFNEQYDVINPKDIPGYLPEQRYRATRGIYIHNEGWFNPRLMIEKLDNCLRQYPNVHFVEDNAVSMKEENGKVISVQLENSEIIEGDRFLLATGATVSKILDASNFDLPVQRVFYGVGVSIELKSTDNPLEKCIRTPNRGLACGLYAVPYFQGPNVANDHILVGASNFITPYPYDYGRLTSVEGLIRGAMEQVNRNFYRADLVRVNVGWRPTSQDSYPMIGKTSLANLVIATATKRDGFHMSPLISENVAALLNDEEIDERFNVFAPERKPIMELTREQAIEKALRHQLNAAYQHGFVPSKNRMVDQVRQKMKDDLEALHDQVGAVDWGIPPEMLDMYRYGHAKI